MKGSGSCREPLMQMAKTKTSRFDVAEYLRTPEEMAAHLEACLEEANEARRL
jgi:DNA-binding phage protein